MIDKHKSAVVLSSYNGEKYIIEQLDSIRRQTIPPDMVMIADDCSTDNTVAIIDNYIKRYKLTTWHLTLNKKNKGWKKSFYDLIDQCDADLIFPCDQDDVWNTRKIELMLPYFNDAAVNLLVSDFVSQKGIIDSYFKEVKNIKLKKHNFNHKIFYIQYLGCVFCFRKSFFNAIKPYYIDGIAHDAFIYIFSLLTDSLYSLNIPLVRHRIHENNSSNEYIAKFKQIPYFNLLICDDLEKYLNDNQLYGAEGKKTVIRTVRKWLNTRINFFETKRFLVFCKLFMYRKCYLHFRTYINDFLTVYFKHG